jgi:hypothetical protein
VREVPAGKREPLVGPERRAGSLLGLYWLRIVIVIPVRVRTS